MINKVELIGRVGQDPEIKHGDNWKLGLFSLATTMSWKTKEGEKKEKTTWHNIQVDGNLTDVVSKYVKKGDLLYIDGSIDNYKYTTKNGSDANGSRIKCKTLKMLGSKASESSQSQGTPTGPVTTSESDDDLPF